jgi:hypothetical protein
MSDPRPKRAAVELPQNVVRPIVRELVVHRFEHNGRPWTIILRNPDYFARDEFHNDTGPFAAPSLAIEWITAIPR